MSEKRSESSDAGLVAAFETATKDNYLGNPGTVGDALRLMLGEVLDIRDGVHMDRIPEGEFPQRVMESMQKTARIFLGQDPNTRPIIGWNQPGGIDEHLVKELRLVDIPPEDRVVNALWQLVKEICQLVAQEQQGMPPENTRWQMDAAIEQTTKLFLGLPMDKPGDEEEEEKDDDE